MQQRKLDEALKAYVALGYRPPRAQNLFSIQNPLPQVSETRLLV
jgi:hypothetical protein